MIGFPWKPRQMSLLWWIQAHGDRRGVWLWRLNRAISAKAFLRAWVESRRQPFRMHHGEQPRLPGYRRPR